MGSKQERCRRSQLGEPWALPETGFLPGVLLSDLLSEAELDIATGVEAYLVGVVFRKVRRPTLSSLGRCWRLHRLADKGSAIVDQESGRPRVNTFVLGVAGCKSAQHL